MELLISSAGYDISCGEKGHIWGNIYFPLLLFVSLMLILLACFCENKNL